MTKEEYEWKCQEARDIARDRRREQYDLYDALLPLAEEVSQGPKKQEGDKAS